MALYTTSPQSRRALLGGLLGGLAAFAAQTLGRPIPVRAQGQAMVVGGVYTDATSVTSLQDLTTNAHVSRLGPRATELP
jgi:hypothetical protein